jgi:hypothetical protein
MGQDMGRPPKKNALDGITRQRRYVRTRRREAAEVARALRVALADITAMDALMSAYPAGSEQRRLLLRGLDQVLVDDPPTADCFDRLFGTD